MRARVPRAHRLRQAVRYWLAVGFGRLSEWAGHRADRWAEAFNGQAPPPPAPAKPKAPSFLVEVTAHGIWVEAPSDQVAVEQFLRMDLKASRAGL